MQDIHSVKVPYKRPLIGAFQIHAAVPALAAPLAFVSAYSAAAFVTGAVVGAVAAGIATKAIGHHEYTHSYPVLEPIG